MTKILTPRKNMLINVILIVFLFCSCNPAEIALLESLTEEAVIVERDLLEPKQTPPVPRVDIPTQAYTIPKQDNQVVGI